MNAINNFQIEKEIARLDGFLSGVALMNGKTKDYSSGAYFVESKSKDFSAEESLKNYYEWLPSLAFSNVQRLGRGMRDLEPAIRPFLVRGVSRMDTDEMLVAQRHLSFMVMEIISSAMDDDYSRVLEVLRMSNTYEPMTSKCEYFCIRLDNGFIFLQFNDDIEFRAGREAGHTAG